MKRKPVTDKMKWQSLLFWADVFCPECEQEVRPTDDIEWDHRHALVHGGPHQYENIRVLHSTCHTEKTIRDVKANAKVKRIAKGGKQRRGPPMAGSRSSPLKRHMDGRVSRR